MHSQPRMRTTRDVLLSATYFQTCTFKHSEVASPLDLEAPLCLVKVRIGVWCSDKDWHAWLISRVRLHKCGWDCMCLTAHACLRLHVCSQTLLNCSAFVNKTVRFPKMCCTCQHQKYALIIGQCKQIVLALVIYFLYSINQQRPLLSTNGCGSDSTSRTKPEPAQNQDNVK